jgi:hypothetical protein
MRVLLRSILKRYSSATVHGCAAILLLAACSQEEKVAPPGLLAVGIDPVSGASVETNKDDYMPGEIVHLVLKGWAVNEDVRLVMTEYPIRTATLTHS